MCGSVLEGVIHQIVQGIAPRFDLPHIRAITLSRFLDVLVEIFRCGYIGGYNVPHGTNLVFHVYMA